MFLKFNKIKNWNLKLINDENNGNYNKLIIIHLNISNK